MSIEQIETGSFTQHRNDPSYPQALRIVSWNIARGCNFNGVAEFLHEIKPDVILLQEADRDTRRTGYRNIARDLSEKLRLNYAFGVEFQELSQGRRRVPAVHGQATLSPWLLSNPYLVRFNHQSTFWYPHWWVPNLAPFQRRLGSRMALVTEVTVGPMRLLTYNAHLESRNGDDLRNRQLKELVDDAGRHRDLPTIIGGDFNFDLTRTPQTDTIRRVGLENSFACGCVKPTLSSSTGKGRAIDCILTSRELHTVKAEVHDSVNASDHYPLSLTIMLQGH